MSCKKLQRIKLSAVRDFQPDIKAIYYRRLSLQRITAQEMEGYDDVVQLDYQPGDLKDLNKKARAVYKRRFEYHEMISKLLENNMIEVLEPVK